jgi:hypothetical protein
MLYIYSEKSELRAEEIIGLLSKNVSKRPWFGTPETVFEGKVTGSRFSVSRVIRGRDTWNPLMRGSVSPLEDGCLVRVVMTFHPVAIILMVGWSFLAAFSASAHGSIPPMAWFLIISPWLIGIPVFIYDVGRSRSLLQQCLKLRSPEEGWASERPEGTQGKCPPSNHCQPPGAPHP